MNEFELKFQIPADRLRDVEAAVNRAAVEKRQLRARYFDTADEVLADAGLVLRIRQEGPEWVQTAKGPGRGGFDRLEHNVPLGSGEPELPPSVARHRGHPVHDQLVHALASSPYQLQAIFDTDVTRTSRTVAAGTASVEIALDCGVVRAGPRTHAVQELEFELKEGKPAAVIELARSWCRSHGLWLDPQSKSALGRRLAHGDAPPGPVKAEPLPDAGRHLVAEIFDSAVQQILGNARELAAGTGSDEHVHQLRVGVRRLRTALRELRDANHGIATLDPQVEATIRKFFAHLGEHRDRATLVPHLVEELAAIGGPMQSWSPPLPDLSAAVRDPQLQDAFLALAALTRELREGNGVAPKALRALAAKRLHALHAKMIKGGRRFERLAQPQRHQVRKRLKRLRYLAELVRPLYDCDEVDRYVRSLKDLQDALGEYQDAAAGRALFEQKAAEDPRAWFGAGWLAAREERLATDCEHACRRAARKAKPFWD